ncbi:hypothetical protein MRX96_000219 [Rhipicephalus microplus]
MSSDKSNSSSNGNSSAALPVVSSGEGKEVASASGKEAVFHLAPTFRNRPGGWTSGKCTTRGSPAADSPLPALVAGPAWASFVANNAPPHPVIRFGLSRQRTTSNHKEKRSAGGPTRLEAYLFLCINVALQKIEGLLLCVPNVSPGSTTATTGYSPHSHHFPFCKSQAPHVEPCDVIPKLLPPGSAWTTPLQGSAAPAELLQCRKLRTSIPDFGGDPCLRIIKHRQTDSQRRPVPALKRSDVVCLKKQLWDMKAQVVEQCT